jgi:predicted transcriptional regulator
MSQRSSNTSTSITVQITPRVSEELEALARDTNQSTTHLASEAISAFIEHTAWQVAHIKAALAEAESGAPGIPHRRVIDWMRSWGTGGELPPPPPKD